MTEIKLLKKQLYYLIFFIISSISCQIIKDIYLGQPIKGTMELDESHE